MSASHVARQREQTPARVRIMTSREAQLLSPTVLCVEPGTPDAVLAAGLVAQREWNVTTIDDVRQAAHHVSVRDTRLVLVAGSSPSWLLQAVTALRAATPGPVAVVSTTIEPEAVLATLDAGVNLVIENLGNPREVAARLMALLRGSLGDDVLQVRWLQSGDMRLDLSSHRCVLGEEKVSLSQNEFELLAFLMAHAQQTVPSHEIVQQVWNWQHGDGINTLRIHIGRLRRKLGDTSAAPRWIASVRGIGYQFVAPVAEVGEDRSEERLRRSVSTLSAQSDAMYSIVDSMLAASTVAEIGELAVQWAVDRNFCDAATVFRLERRPSGDASRLVASAGMSSRWRQALATGHPVQSGFMGAHAYSSGEVVQLSDVSRLAKRFPVTARMSSAEDLHACLLFPLVVEGVIWGDVAFLSRSTKAFPPARTSFLRSVAGVVSLAVHAASRAEEDR